MPWIEQVEGVLFGLGVGAAIIATIWAVIAGAWSTRSGALTLRDPVGDFYPTPVSPVHEYPEAITEAHGPMPTIVIAIVVGFVLWAIGYVALFVQRGFTFS